jgi:hypothetical protein
MYALGELSRWGAKDGAEDYAKARECFQKAADAGNSEGERSARALAPKMTFQASVGTNLPTPHETLVPY